MTAMNAARPRDREIAFVVEAGDEPSAAELARLRAAIEGVLDEAAIERATLSVALVDDPTIHRLNREFLAHDEPTDVVTFPLSEPGGEPLEGEIVVSVDTAARTAARLEWPAADELLLYVVHGALHLVGYDDRDADSRAAMRAAERRHLARLGLDPPGD
jgi:probable rRNA maturation factor